MEVPTERDAVSFTASPKRFLIVDDHPMVRDSLHALLESLEDNIVTDLALNMKQMTERLKAGPAYQYAIVDLSLPDGNGVEIIKAAQASQPDIPLIVFSGRIEQDLILRCLSMGVVGYVPKTHYNDLIAQAFRMILAGQVYIPRQAVTEQQQVHYSAMRPIRQATSDPRQLCLTERQIDVLDLILQGMPNKLICRQLQLAEGTVKVHVSAVLRALGVRNRTQAVIAASKMGLRVNRASTSRSPLPRQPIHETRRY